MARAIKPPSPAPASGAGDVLTKALLRAAAALGLSRRELARIIGISEPTLSRAARGRHLDPASKPGELAALFLRAYRSLDALLGGDAGKARLWLRAANAHLNAVPAELMAHAAGLALVVEYLDAARGRM